MTGVRHAAMDSCRCERAENLRAMRRFQSAGQQSVDQAVPNTQGDRTVDSDMHLALAVIVATRSLPADPGDAWGGGWTALNFAAFAGHTDVVRLLVDAGSPVNKRDKDGTTALMWAAQYNHGPATQLLLEVGADVNNQEVHGTTALMLSAKEGHTATMEPLLAHGVAPNIQSDEGWTALMLPEWRSPGG